MRRLRIQCPKCKREYVVDELQIIFKCPECKARLRIRPLYDFEAITLGLEGLPAQADDDEYPYNEQPYTNDVRTKMLHCCELLHVHDENYAGFISLMPTKHGSRATSGSAAAFVAGEWLRLKTVLSVGNGGFLIPRTAIPIDIDFSKGFRVIYEAVHP